MNCIKQLDIRLSKEYFYPGEIIEGKLVIDVVDTFNLNVIYLMVRGKAHCESKVYISGQRRVIKDDQYFINERMVIWESPQSDTDDNDLEKGIHEFPFSFRLPDSDMPCSLESRACSIRYHMRALLAMSETDQVPQGIKYFTIIGPLIDCNDNKYLNPIFGAEKRWQYGFCFCYRKPIATLRSILERTAYCSGETVKLKSFIQNNSDEAVKLKVRLVQFCEFNTQRANLCGVTKEVQHLVLEYTSDELVPNENLEITTSHCLPILPPSIIGVCRLVQLYYSLIVSLEFEYSGQDLQMLFPIKIATRPFNGGQPYKMEYGASCDHVEGGMYIDPEFSSLNGNRFWDDKNDEIEPIPDSEPVPLYRPVYLKISPLPSLNPQPHNSRNSTGDEDG